MGYLREFAKHWPNLLGASLGNGFGMALSYFMMNLFGPVLMDEFHWTKAQWAVIGTLGLSGILFTPFAGRIADVFGTRKTTIAGYIALSASYLLLSIMGGSIWQFYAILVFQFTLGVLTGNMVFTRVAVERFDTARGVALACVISAAPLTGVICAPLIGAVIGGEGWRAAYQLLALMTALAGLTAVMLVERGRGRSPVAAPGKAKFDWSEFRKLCSNRVFLLLFAGMFLVNIPQALTSSQMSVMLKESGSNSAFSTALVSVYAMSIVIGRFISGYALDRIAPHLVAIVALGLPAVGFLAIASPFDAPWVLAGSMVLLGVAQGAETDIAAMLASRRFGIANYSFVFSLLSTAISLASVMGAGLLSVTLVGGGTFNLFLFISAAVTLAGTICVYLIGGRLRQDDALRAATGVVD